MKKQFLFIGLGMLLSAYGISACPMHDRLRAAQEEQNKAGLDQDFDLSDIDIDDEDVDLDDEV
jgi:hypothetical protein